jgi:preprotein translocase subunit SecF
MIDFLKSRNVCFAFSFFLLLLGLLSFFIKGGFVYSIDFTGGSEIRLAFTESVQIEDLRRSVNSDLFGETKIQEVAGGKDFIINVAKCDESVEEILVKNINQAIPNNVVSIKSIEKVGPEAGSEVRYNAIIAVLLSLIAMGLYITFRQRYAFAVGAIAALAHDILVVLTFCLVTGEPISLIVLAAILTIVGYSINDTIIIFCRINDNLGLSKKMDGFQIVNYSLNQTLSRTLLTSFSTLLSMLSIYFFGGPALASFSKIMIIGIIFGTYSSIYIASPIMLLLNDQFKKYNNA